MFLPLFLFFFSSPPSSLLPSLFPLPPFPSSPPFLFPLFPLSFSLSSLPPFSFSFPPLPFPPSPSFSFLSFSCVLFSPFPLPSFLPSSSFFSSPPSFPLFFPFSSPFPPPSFSFGFALGCFCSPRRSFPSPLSSFRLPSVLLRFIPSFPLFPYPSARPGLLSWPGPLLSLSRLI
ncbi:hypothetical protein, partial [Kiloniella majae]|uniref:hypothetical protein n=1 Tax=Kiloniella majae TaxID=1938558 RepID=UPI0015C51927